MQYRSISLSVNGRHIHALTSGDGPIILLCHASPMNSSSLAPLIQRLSDTYTVVALDTPGYGESELPVTKPKHLSAYSEIIEQIRAQIGVQKLAIYGTATGAQIAVRYGLDYPDRVSQLFLDNVAHFSSELADQVMDHYFPDLSPQLDGTHLPTLWDNVLHLFQYFPWCWKTPEFQLSSPMPPVSVLHQVALLYLKAGATYDWAYRVAFEHERREYLAQLQVPTTIIRWDWSIVKAYTDQIFEIDLPENVSAFRITSDQDRYDAIAEEIRTKYQAVSKGAMSTLIKTAVANKQAEETLPEELLAYQSKADITPEISGAYLTKAWQLCRTIFPHKELDELNSTFINWISKV